MMKKELKRTDKGGEFITNIIDMNNDGEGIGKTDAFTWFIKDTVPGDKVSAVIMKTKKTYGYARLKKIIEPSDDRVTPECPIARACGGCSLQSMSYAAQLKYKSDKVLNNLVRIGGFDKESFNTSKESSDGSIEFGDIIGMDDPWRYRNKAQYPIGKDRDGNLIAGFYASRTHSIIKCDDCLIGIEENKQVLDIVLEHMKTMNIESYDEENNKGIVRHVIIRKGFTSGQLMVCLVINADSLPGEAKLSDELMKLEAMKTVVVNTNIEATNVIFGKKTRVISGPGYITDKIGDIEFRISAESFYQVNSVQTEKLYNKVLEFAGITAEETVWDLYCGIGTISLFLAQKAKHVYGVEIVKQAIDDARLNSKINKINNASFFVGKAEEVLPREYAEHGAYADVIVVDPPRKGCDEMCLSTMVKMSPKKIVYVSCDSATLARDLKYLSDNGYELKKVQAVDQFPMTGHVETIVLMSKK